MARFYRWHSSWYGTSKKILNGIKIAAGIIGTLILGWKITNFLGNLSGAILKIKTFLGLFKGGKKTKGLGEALGVGADTMKSVKAFEVPNVKTILKGLADLAIIIGGTMALLAVIGAFMKIPRT